MIDAYEIGIQLALQDGVSAGLEVIGRQLAEVDRAVAASSAGIMALTRAAEGAVRAVAAAAGVRAPDMAKAPSSEHETQNATQVERTTARSGETPAAPIPATPAPAASAPLTLAPVVERGEPASAGAGEASPSLSPQPQPAAVSSRPEPGTAPVIVQQAFAAAAPAPSEVAPATTVATVATAPEQPMRDVGPVAPSAAPPSRGAPQANTGSRPVSPMRAAVAEAVGPRLRPWLAGEEARVPQAVSFAMPSASPQSAGAPGAIAAQERAAAPQPQSRESGGGGGSVMLDGRLVGYWLSEQMAREASRPPGGTSFFDPRQTPAWTPSGAL